MKKKLYMAVTPDKYELPIAVEEDIHELAKKFNLKPINIFVSISRGGTGTARGAKFVRLEIEEEGAII